MDQLKMSQGHAKLNILKEWMAIIAGSSNIAVPSLPKQSQEEAHVNLTSPRSSNSANATKFCPKKR